jgi:hypothetical protein
LHRHAGIPDLIPEPRITTNLWMCWRIGLSFV